MQCEVCLVNEVTVIAHDSEGESVSVCNKCDGEYYAPYEPMKEGYMNPTMYVVRYSDVWDRETYNAAYFSFTKFLDMVNQTCDHREVLGSSGKGIEVSYGVCSWVYCGVGVNVW